MAYADWRRGDLGGTKGEALLVFHYSQSSAPRARSVRADRPPPWWVAYLVKRRQARNVFLASWDLTFGNGHDLSQLARSGTPA